MLMMWFIAAYPEVVFCTICIVVYCFIVLLFYCFIVLLFYCFIVYFIRSIVGPRNWSFRLPIPRSQEYSCFFAAIFLLLNDPHVPMRSCHHIMMRSMKSIFKVYKDCSNDNKQKTNMLIFGAHWSYIIVCANVIIDC